MAETQHSVRLIKEFSYRGQTRKFSNRYYFDGGAPDDWDQVLAGYAAMEAIIYRAFVTIMEAHGYNPGSDIAVASTRPELPGQLSAAGQTGTPGDCAVLLRMATTKRSRLNHPVFCFSYYHGAMIPTGDMPADSVHSAQVAAVQSVGQILQDGITINGRDYVRTTPDGHQTTGHFVSPYVHHRDFLN